MKVPESINSVSLSYNQYEVPYPPLGFLPFLEHQLGNGDTFGLYWPIGCEDREPIVAETYHDEFSLVPHFSSLDKFIELTPEDSFSEEDEEDSFPGTPTYEQDPKSPAACFQKAKECLQSRDLSTAIEHLKNCVAILPEYEEAQSLLCTQYRRIGENDLAVATAIQAFISPIYFGNSSSKLVGWLAKQTNCPDEYKNDPIWLNRNRPFKKFGDSKENDEYLFLKDAIVQYIDQSEFVSAMKLMQKYAGCMYQETVSFQERYNFNLEDFITWQKNIAEIQYGNKRDPDFANL